ncbi:MAG TPA: hypothetical protein VD994_18675 [Prosthecobacter sp.]|nr:hypothetical protein [Prosthecobacter sp.]
MKVIRDPNDPANARREGYIPGSERPAAPRRPADTSAPASNGTLPPRPADTLQGRNEQAAEPTDQTLTTPTIIAPTAPIIESGTGLNASGSGSGNLGIRGNRTAGPDGRTGLNASGSASGNLGINRNVAPPPNGSTGLSPTGSATGNLGTRPSSSGSSTGLSPTGSAKGNLGIRPSQ